MNGVKLVGANDETIPVGELKDGQLAVLRDGGWHNRKGSIVQRHKNDLVLVGNNSNWGVGWFNSSICQNLRVRPLKPREKLEVQ